MFGLPFVAQWYVVQEGDARMLPCKTLCRDNKKCLVQPLLIVILIMPKCPLEQA